MQAFLFAVYAIIPLIALAVTGGLAKSRGIIGDSFVSSSSLFIFYFSAPALLFHAVATIDISRMFDPGLVAYAVVVTLVGFGLSWLVALAMVPDSGTRGIFVQGCFRSNLGIIGIALALSLFGSQGLATTSLLMAFVVPLYNILAMIVLLRYAPDATAVPGWKDNLRTMARNPLILAIFSGILFSLAGWQLAEPVERFLRYLGSLTLPLAMVGVGASFQLLELRRSSRIAFGASFIKLVLIPAIAVGGAIALGYRGTALGVIFIITATPSASVGFAMAQALGGDERLAGNIILVTTAASAFTIGAGIFALRALQMI